MEILRDLKVEVSEADVLRRQGRPKQAGPPSAYINKLITETIKEGYELVRPQSLYDEMGASLNEQGKVVLSSGTVLDIPHVRREWAGLEMVTLAICTIGRLLEERSSQLFAQGDAATALILDTVGSAAVGSVARQVDALICRQSQARGMNAGPRFEPGSTGWDIRDQRVLFSLLPAQEIGVNLNEYFLMIPRKSVSFMMGMGSEVTESKLRLPCHYCERLDCPSREVTEVAL